MRPTKYFHYPMKSLSQGSNEEHGALLAKQHSVTSVICIGVWSENLCQIRTGTEISAKIRVCCNTLWHFDDVDVGEPGSKGLTTRCWCSLYELADSQKRTKVNENQLTATNYGNKLAAGEEKTSIKWKFHPHSTVEIIIIIIIGTFYWAFFCIYSNASCWSD